MRATKIIKKRKCKHKTPKSGLWAKPKGRSSRTIVLTGDDAKYYYQQLQVVESLKDALK